MKPTLPAVLCLLLTGSIGLPSALDGPTPASLDPATTDGPTLASLDAALASHSGFLGAAPAPDGSPIFHAAYSGDVPAIPPALVPQGWTLDLHGFQAVGHLRAPVPSVVDLQDLAQAESHGAAPLPADAIGLGPGTPLLTTIPGEGTFICTANFVFESGGKHYLGAAGHCFLPEGRKATHGSGADYSAAGVVTEACVDLCVFGGQLTGFLGDMVTLGPVAYARQTGAGGDIGNDFGVVEIPASLVDLVRPAMPMWGGPTGADGFEGTGSPLAHYGNGIDAGTVVATKGRAGTGLNDGLAISWQANIESNGGDSGSAVNHLAANLHGAAALGVLTHGLITGTVPLTWGTTIEQALAMATEANLNLQLVLEDGGSGGGTTTAVHVHAIDTAWEHYGGGAKGHRTTTTVTVRDASGQPAAGVGVSVEVNTPAGLKPGTGTTDSAGVAIITTQVSNGGHGTWTSCVTGLSGPGYSYDSGANLETCQSTTVA